MQALSFLFYFFIMNYYLKHKDQFDFITFLAFSLAGGLFIHSEYLSEDHGALLLSLMLVPLLAIFVLFFVPAKYSEELKFIGFAALTYNFVLSLFLWFLFDKSTSHFQFVFYL